MRSYPWYERVTGPGLEQGDLLPNLPVIVPRPDLSFPLPEDVQGEVQVHDTIVMTQSCDLTQDKVKEVILCPHWDLETAAAIESSVGKKGVTKAIRDGRMPRYLLLGPSDVTDCPLRLRIVNFGKIFSLPKPYVQTFADTLGPRLRLCPPYREHLAQGFARFFMRVGLPQDIKL